MNPDDTQNLKEWSHQKRLQHKEFEATRTSFIKIEPTSIPLKGKSFIIRAVCIIIIAVTVYLDYKILLAPQTPRYYNVLTALNFNSRLADKIAGYIDYVTGKVRVEGYKSLDNKWIGNIPPEFKVQANKKISQLNKEGYAIKKIYSDKKNIFTVECEAFTKEKEIVYFDIKKIRIGQYYIFRLLKVY